MSEISATIAKEILVSLLEKHGFGTLDSNQLQKKVKQILEAYDALYNGVNEVLKSDDVK